MDKKDIFISSCRRFAAVLGICKKREKQVFLFLRFKNVFQKIRIKKKKGRGGAHAKAKKNKIRTG
jgi:hypothetical protein